MKKAGIATLLILIFSSAAFGQLGISKGLIGGMNLASLSGADVPSDSKSVTGFAGGIFLELNIPGPFSIEAEALYSQKGVKVNVLLAITDIYAYADIPILLKYFLPIPVVRTYLYAGPSYSILLSAKRKTEGPDGTNAEADIKDWIPTNDIGAVVGLGVGFSILRVDARYNFGLSTLDKNGTFKMYNRVAAVYAGIEF